MQPTRYTAAVIGAGSGKPYDPYMGGRDGRRLPPV